ncbi:MAG TPA: CheR family methyltransferase [Vicinamibacterales bacterium]|nr:CheR family methyltransferase [Vicinamibacterales bacterium]
MPLSEVKQLLRQTTGLEAALVGESAVERAIGRRRRECGLADSNGYFRLLRTSPVELQALVESIVVPETSFFRDPEVFVRLATFATEWMRAPSGRQMRLLSVPCASGEEPYSIAITLLDAGVPAGGFSIDAVDVSTASLAHARIGIYGDASFRGEPLGRRSRYFTTGSLGLRVNDDVRRHVRFAQGNLLGDPPPFAGSSYDVVFCRNLLIYFALDAQRRAIEVLTRLVQPGGLMFVGAAETVACINQGLVPDMTPRAFAFRGAGTEPAIPFRTSSIVGPIKASGPAPAAPARVSLAPSAASPDGDETAAVIEGCTRLANLGRLEEAVRSCRALIDREGPSADALHLLGVIHDAEGRRQDAVKYYRQAIYLDPHHEGALTHLALALTGRDQNDEADRLRLRARRAAVRSEA